MDEQTQQQFIQWISEKLGVNSEQELQSALQEMGEEGIQQAMQQFTQEMQGNQQAAAFLQGGRLDYIKSLQSLKKGGKIKNGVKDAMTARNITKWNTSKDGKSAKMEGNRKEAPKQWISAKAK